ncbi:Saccharopine dehydrogenase-domain-containing protein [Phyllosticta citribraziliensis]|uniref:Saccharopine dehydrogenase-domain-containing protein n=1 Tax=Phyllosticta citribraziliensis TaxID=989973 RepID=A0ABR1LTQ8_9PEZI
MSASRIYDLVLLGATGYTGKYTVDHLASVLPIDFKWAIAGRNEKKLSDIVQTLIKQHPDSSKPEIEILQLEKSELDVLAKKTKLIISTVGPFMKYGTPVVEACATNGTHYVDCTGEVPWVKEMIDKYHETAKTNGAMMIPQCGLDSVPADIITYVVATHIRRKLNAGTTEVLNSVKMKGKPSGGTLLTLLSLLDHYSISQITTSMKPFALSPVQPPSTNSSPKTSLFQKIFGVRQDKDLGVLTDWVQSNMDAAIVYRSWGLLDGGKTYGANFRFSEWLAIKSTIPGALVHFVMLFGAAMIALPPVRWTLRKLVYQPGEGPSVEDTKDDFCHYKAVGIADTAKQERALGQLVFKGSQYYFTGLAIAEAALVILRGQQNTEAKKLGGGILTPATLGDEYVERLRDSNVKIDVKLI